MQERLQKLIARAGVASRRHAEQLIVAGHVTVNGAVVTELGRKADPERDSIKVAGKLLRFREGQVYLVLHKPMRCVSTLSDPEKRKTVRDFLRGVDRGVFPVGRLDYHAEGLLLITSDGELANLVLRSKDLRQTFWMKVKGALSEEEIRRAAERAGARLRLLKGGANAWYEATLAGARRDTLREALAAMGHPVEKMKRVRLANLELGKLEPGEYRHLSAEEVAGLRRAITGAGKKQRQEKRRQASEA